MSESTASAAPRKSAARIAANYALWYVAFVALCAALRTTASYVGGPAWIVESMPWPEVFYGPAIALGTIFGVAWLTPKVEAWLQRRAAARD